MDGSQPVLKLSLAGSYPERADSAGKIPLLQHHPIKSGPRAFRDPKDSELVFFSSRAQVKHNTRAAPEKTMGRFRWTDSRIGTDFATGFVVAQR